jgi:S-adenosyl methyltransferase
VTSDSPAPLIDTTVSHSARVWNYWLGGKDYYPVDREAGDRVAAMYPDIVLLARAARAFLTRAVLYLAGEAGIRQFLDVGTGLPTVNNTHQVAQSVAPESRVVYADNDPLVLAHARALLTSSPEGATDYIDADLHDPGKILQEAARTLDFTQPVAITLIAILHHISDYGQARSIVNRLMEAVPSGSYLVLSHSTNVIYGAVSDEAVGRWNKFGKPPVTLRSPEQIVGFFDGLELLEPGVVSTPRWRPDIADIGGGVPREVDQFCGVGRKP